MCTDCSCGNHLKLPKSGLARKRLARRNELAVARNYEEMVTARTDCLNKTSTDLVKNHDIAGIEDLQVANLLRNRKLSKAISEVSWSGFHEMPGTLTPSSSKFH